MNAILHSVHIIFAIIALIGPLAVLFLLRGPIEIGRVKWFRLCDGVGGLAATLMLIIGLLLMFYYGKGVDYYMSSLPFIIKLALYGMASLLSPLPTLEIRRWSAAHRLGRQPQVSSRYLRLLRLALVTQVLCVLGMALCGSLAARGLGSLA